jgi:hypothetical protein
MAALQQYLAVNILIRSIRIGKMHADIAQGKRAQQGIADGVQQHVCIAVTERPFMMGNLYAPQPEIPAFRKLVKIYSETDPVRHHDYFKKKRSVSGTRQSYWYYRVVSKLKLPWLLTAAGYPGRTGC